MVKDRNITININDTSPLANTAYVDSGKENKVYNKDQVNELIEDLREGTLGSILPSQTLVQLNALADGNYYAAEAGTYAFGEVVPIGWQYRFNKSDTQWKVLTKIELKIYDYTEQIRIIEDKLPNKVDKVSGKGLSTNDFTNTQKNKVDKVNISGEGKKVLSDNGDYIAFELEKEYKKLEANFWDGNNSILKLTSETILTLDTTLNSGNLKIEKEYFNRYNLSINGVIVKLPYGDCLLSFIKKGSDLEFFVKPKSFSSTHKLLGRSFNGTASDVIIKNDPKFHLSVFSICFSATITSGNFVAVSKGSSENRNWDVIFTNKNTPTPEIQFNIGKLNLVNNGLELNKKYEICCTYDGVNAKLYIDGILKKEGATLFVDGGSLMIGQILNLYSIGNIYDLFITNIALSQTQIKEYATSSIKSPLVKSFSNSVVEYFPFDENSGGLPSVPKFSIYPEPILRRGSRDWNSGDIANPDLTIDELKLSGYRYILSYSAYGTTKTDNSPKWRLALAFSNNLDDPNSWIVDKDWSFEPNSNEGYISSNGSIVIKNNKFYHFYQTGDSGSIATSHIRAAVSEDLKIWTRLNDGNPVIQRSEIYESKGAYDPSTRLNENGEFEMTYCGYNGQHCIVYATSTDGINWVNKKKVVELNNSGSSEPSYLKINDYYFVSCDLYNGSVRNVYAQFTDGNSPILSNSMIKIIDGEDKWNFASCFDSYCHHENSKIYCFFTGGVTNSVNEGLSANIGMAISY